MEENRIAVIAIVVENPASVRELNEILHTFSAHIIGRMGLPYREKKLSLISVAVDAPEAVILDLAGKLAALDGVTAETAWAKA
ncbi:MAG: iron-only hydrogenase system regulator [Solobacterium sp.]|nr:iron-only hydrogenase system regulator [Solobacterium sp.]